MQRRIVANFDAINGPFLAKLRQIDGSISRFERTAGRSFNKIERGVNRVVVASAQLRTVSSVLAFGFGADLAANFLDASGRIQNALISIGADSDEIRRKVLETSVATLAGFEDTTRVLQRFQKSLPGQDIERTLKQVATLNRLLAVGGKTQQERSSTQIQFGQALQANQLGGEELRAIRENAPVELVNAIAREAGGSISSLKDLARQGKLTRDVMVRALESLEQESIERFASVEVLIADAAQNFKSAAIEFTGAFDDAAGISDAVVGSLIGLSEIMLSNSDAARVLGESFKILGGIAIATAGGRGLASITRTIQSQAKARRDLAAATRAEASTAIQAAANDRLAANVAQTKLAILRATGGTTRELTAAQKALDAANAKSAVSATTATTATNAFAAAQARLSLATRVTTSSMAALRGALAFFGGPLGLAFTVIAGSALLLGSNAEASGRSVEGLTQKLGELQGKISEIRDLNSKLEKDTERLASVNETLEKAIRAQGDAAGDVLRLEVDAIRKRIAANKGLISEYKAVLQAQLAIAKNDLVGQERNFENEALERQGGLRGFLRRRADEINDLVGGLENPEVQKLFRQEARSASSAIREMIIAAQEGGSALTELDVGFLKSSVAVGRLRNQVELIESSLVDLDKPSDPAPVIQAGSGDSQSGGRGKSQAEKFADIILDAEAALAAATKQTSAVGLLNEQLIAQQESIRLVERAESTGIRVTRERLEIIDKVAKAIASEKAEMERLEQANELAASAQEESLSVQQKAERQISRNIALIPQLTQVLLRNSEALGVSIGQESAAERAAEIVKNQNEKVIDSFTGVQELIDAADSGLSDALLDAATGARSLDDALKDVLGNLAKIALNKALEGIAGQLFGGGSGGSGAGIVSGVIGLIGSAFGGSSLPASFSGGGKITGPGTGTSDSIPIYASDGEFMVNAAQTKKFLPLLKRINDNTLPGFRDGGMIGSSPAIAIPSLTPVVSGASGDINININLDGAVSNEEIRRISRQGVAEGLAEYDRNLGNRITEVNVRNA